MKWKHTRKHQLHNVSLIHMSRYFGNWESEKTMQDKFFKCNMKQMKDELKQKSEYLSLVNNFDKTITLYLAQGHMK